MIRAAALCLTLAVGPAAAQPSEPASVFVADSLAAFAYGIYCAVPPNEVEEAPGTAAGVVNLMDSVPELMPGQTVVPAELGIGFGVVLQAGGERVFDPVIVTIRHPPYPDSGIEVEQWVTSIGSLSPSLIGFSFELRQELVVGPWTFQAEANGETLFQITFDVVPAGLGPSTEDLCTGALLS